MQRTDGGDPDRARDDDHDHGNGDHADHGGDPSHGHEEDAVHAHEHDFGSIGVGVVTVSTSRTLENDPAGDAVAAAIEDTDHEIATRELVDDDHDGIQGSVNALVGREDVDCVVTTGGTGVTPDDVTVEAVRPLFGKELPGFGELFRALSREEIGTRVVATRTTAGIADRGSSGGGPDAADHDDAGGVPVFCLPGSENAARLGVDIVIEEAPHLAGLATRDEG
jgi:molybdenum cofactor biosynthesis protein B